MSSFQHVLLSTVAPPTQAEAWPVVVANFLEDYHDEALYDI